MKLARLMTDSGPVLAVKAGDSLIGLAAFLRHPKHASAHGEGALDALRSAAASGEPAIGVALNGQVFVGRMAAAAPEDLTPFEVKQPARFLPPVLHPEKVVAIGRNYLAHALEGQGGVPKEVLFFMKSPSCLIGA